MHDTWWCCTLCQNNTGTACFIVYSVLMMCPPPPNSYDVNQASMLSGNEGPHRLAAVLAGFRLLNTALNFDMGAAEAINSMTVRERVAPLHNQLVSPQRRLAVLLQYVLYSNMDLQYEVRVE